MIGSPVIDRSRRPFPSLSKRWHDRWLIVIVAGTLIASLGAPPKVTAAAAAEASPRVGAKQVEVELLERTLLGKLTASALDRNAKTISLEGSTLPLRDVLRIQFRATPVSPRWNTSIRLADGTRLHGDLEKSDDPDQLRLRIPSLERTLSVPLEWVRELRRNSAVPERNDDVDEDQVRTKSGASIRGVIESIRAGGITIEDANLGALELPWEQVEWVRVAPLDPTPVVPLEQIPAIIETDDGSRLRGALRKLGSDACELASPLVGEISIPETRRVSLELLLDRIAYLSDRDPIAVEEGIPFSDYFPWTWKRDRNVLGGPMQIGRTSFRKGIGVHSKSSLTFAITEGDEVFRARAGIDVIGRPVDDNPRVGSVRFVVLLDGQEAYRSGDVGWDDAPVSIDVPLSGRSQLTLVVEMGIGHHVLDRANWGDARLLRK